MANTHHDLHDFMLSAKRSIAEEYARIARRAVEDPGTAGDQGEDNWMSLLRKWLPRHYHVRTKGRLLGASGEMSGQVDVVVLKPAYPPALLDTNAYLAGGVAATFECKTTLKAAHIADAIENVVKIRRLLPQRIGTPFRELYSPIFCGLLAHSHSWKRPASQPFIAIEEHLIKADANHVMHPREMLDVLCVADLGCWTPTKIVRLLVQNGASVTTQELCTRLGITPDRSLTQFHRHWSGADDEIARIEGRAPGGPSDVYSPVGTLVAELLRRLHWEDPQLRDLAEYFRQVNIGGNAIGVHQRSWPPDIFSAGVRRRLDSSGTEPNTDIEWSGAFG